MGQEACQARAVEPGVDSKGMIWWGLDVRQICRGNPAGLSTYEGWASPVGESVRDWLAADGTALVSLRIIRLWRMWFERSFAEAGGLLGRPFLLRSTPATQPPLLHLPLLQAVAEIPFRETQIARCLRLVPAVHAQRLKDDLFLQPLQCPAEVSGGRGGRGP
jgi:hypothetical protein